MTLRTKEIATLAVGATETDSIDLKQGVPVGIIVTGSGLSGNTLTFKVSNDNITFYPLYSQTAEVSLTAGSYIRSYALNKDDFEGWGRMKIVLGTSASQVAQKTIATTFEVNVV